MLLAEYLHQETKVSVRLSQNPQVMGAAFRSIWRTNHEPLRHVRRFCIRSTVRMFISVMRDTERIQTRCEFAF